MDNDPDQISYLIDLNRTVTQVRSLVKTVLPDFGHRCSRTDRYPSRTSKSGTMDGLLITTPQPDHDPVRISDTDTPSRPMTSTRSWTPVNQVGPPSRRSLDSGDPDQTTTPFRPRTPTTPTGPPPDRTSDSDDPSDSWTPVPYIGTQSFPDFGVRLSWSNFRPRHPWTNCNPK